jgi:hypothetical protein
MASPAKIVSGGQTGADRAALDVAVELGIDVGGWVPAGRAAENGVIPLRYPNLRETDSAAPEPRTARNVRDSDATLILSHGSLSGGSALTRELARQAGRPVLHLDLAATTATRATSRLVAWLARLQPSTLNVAGPRASEDPRIYDAARAVLRSALARRGDDAR